jgi:hypothetical protein
MSAKIYNLELRRKPQSCIRVRAGATRYTDSAISFLKSYWSEQGSPIPDETVIKEAQRRNNFTLSIVTEGESHTVRGVVEHYALKRASMEELLSGKTDEANIRESDLIEAAAPLEKGLYVAITCPESETSNYSIIGLATLYSSVLNLNSILDENDNIQHIDLWAIDSTPEGAEFMREDAINFAVHTGYSEERTARFCTELAWYRRYKGSLEERQVQNKWRRHLRGFSVADK